MVHWRYQSYPKFYALYAKGISLEVNCLSFPCFWDSLVSGIVSKLTNIWLKSSTSTVSLVLQKVQASEDKSLGPRIASKNIAERNTWGHSLRPMKIPVPQASRFLSMTSAFWRLYKFGKIAATQRSSVVDNCGGSKPSNGGRQILGSQLWCHSLQKLFQADANESRVTKTAVMLSPPMPPVSRRSGETCREDSRAKSANWFRVVRTQIAVLSCLSLLQPSGWIEILKETAPAFWPFRMNSTSEQKKTTSTESMHILHIANCMPGFWPLKLRQGCASIQKIL